MHRAEKTTARILALLLLLAALLAGTSAAEGSRTGHEAIAAFRPEAVSGAEDMERILCVCLGLAALGFLLRGRPPARR